MAPCKLGRPAMGSDGTISRSDRQGPPLPDTDLARAADSDFLSNISLEPGRTGYVESLVRLQAEAAGDDFLLDLGGAVEDEGERLKLAADELATAYPARRLSDLLGRVGATPATSADCWTPRTTLAEYRCLLVVGGAGCPCWPPPRRSTCTAITPPRQSTCAQPRS